MTKTSKNISIRADLYERLTKLKQKDQSYSDFMEVLLDEGVKGSFSRLMKYFGVIRDFPEEIEEKIADAKEKMNADLQERSRDNSFP
jgi:predicted CopG family antitoxin